MSSLFDKRLTFLEYLIPSSKSILFIIDSNLINYYPIKTLVDFFNKKKQLDFCVLSFNKNKIKIIDSKIKKYETTIYFNSSRLNFFISKNILFQKKNTKHYCVINSFNNPRWIIPRFNVKKISFSGIFTATSFKARFALKLYSILFSFKLDYLLFNNNIIISTNNNSTPLNKTLYEFIQNNMHKYGIIYTGSLGTLQKFTFEIINENNKSIFFGKIGHNKLTKEAINKEYSSLKYINSKNLKYTNHPKNISVKKMDDLDDIILFQDSINFSSKEIHLLTNLHIRTIKELNDLKSSKIGLSLFLNSISSEFNNYISNNDYNVMFITIDKLNKQFKQIKKQYKSKYIKMVLSHGDFTPWNIRIEDKKINLIDFEELGERPLLHDLYHYIFIVNVIIKRRTDYLNLIEEMIDYSKLLVNKISRRDRIFYLKIYLINILNQYLFHYFDHIKNKYPKKINIDLTIKRAFEMLKIC